MKRSFPKSGPSPPCHTPTKKDTLKLCENNRSLISHPSKFVLRIILNRLKSKAEELLALD
ncbi:hypothetical protein DPMN_105180 [Dreissena polymorpha]|uniref:Uncharacterized protein n=1 Tax=Dreissena polymorpha TaxID=45954 RepID=A0A9D4HB51_DREPO|nr:hypothetical protein DPMN_105180 [Dreissena polymorpha]